MDRHNENDDMHMKDTQNTEAQEEACAGAEAGDAGDAVQTLPENLESLCHEHVCPNCTEKRDADDARLRAAAEMDNFKKRLKREHEDQIRYAAEKVMSDLLPTLDNLDLALQYGSKDEACKDMLQGVAMTRKLLLEAVARHGLTPVGTAGEAFTPELHEAVGFDAEADVEAGAVARVLQSGYKLGERLLRPAKVMIKQGSAPLPARQPKGPSPLGEGPFLLPAKAERTPCRYAGGLFPSLSAPTGGPLRHIGSLAAGESRPVVVAVVCPASRTGESQAVLPLPAPASGRPAKQLDFQKDCHLA